MANRKNKAKKKSAGSTRKIKESVPVTIKLHQWQKNLLVCTIIALLLMVLYAPFIFQDQVYKENDNLQFAIVNHGFYQNSAKTEVSNWNPNPWGGIPNTFEIPRSALSADFYLMSLSKILSLPFVFFLWGAIGMFFLARHLGFSALLSGACSVFFILAPYYKSLLIVGHINKLLAIMHLPWVLWSALLLIKKPKLLTILFLP